MKQTHLMRAMILCASCCALSANALENAAVSEVEPIITDRPDFTESTQVVPLNQTQIEGGFTYARVGAEKLQSLGEVLVRRAINRKTELRLQALTRSRLSGALGNSSGFEDMGLGFKVSLSPGSGKFGLKNPRVSLIGATSLPTGSRALRSTRLQPELKLLFGWDLSSRLSLSSNLNAAYLNDDNGRFTEVAASASLGYSVSERVGSFLEIYGFVPSGNRPNTQFVNGGFAYLVNPDFQLDARVGFGLGNDVGGPDFFAGVGVARRF